MTNTHLSASDDFTSSTMSTPNENSDKAVKPAVTQHESISTHASEFPTYSGLYHGLLPDTLPNLSSEAAAATQDEHRMTIPSALRLYPKAIGWSAAISLAIIMEGYDTALINGFYAFPAFQRRYGDLRRDGSFEISTKWQTSFSNAATSGSVIGLFINGILTQRLGYRATMMLALTFLAAFIFLSFFAQSKATLLAGQVLCGISWGVFSTLTTTYAAEVLPTSLRGYLTAAVNLCWLIGQMVAFGVLRGLLSVESQWSYRIPFGLQWAWIIAVFALTYLAPESPWWLVQRGRLEDARRSLLRLVRRDLNKFKAEDNVELMQHTNESEKTLNNGRGTTYLQCFRGTNLRRTEIACMIFVIQNLSGLPVISFAAYFYTKIGFDQARSFDLTIAMQGVAIFAALISYFLQTYFGRRQLYLTGLALQFLILLAAGVMGVMKETSANLWATAGLVLAFIFVFDLIVGPLTYCLVAELPSTRLRVKTVVLSRVSYNLCCLVTNVIQNHMLNSASWNWRSKSCFFWAGTCLLSFVYCFFRLPETRGLTYLELDLLFEKRADARKFEVFRKKLASTGYFSIYEADGASASWVEPRRRSTHGRDSLAYDEKKD